MPNAFAVGNQVEAAVAVTDGLLRILPPRELAGVLGHELAHIRHNDLRVMVTADAVARVTSTFARIGFLVLIFGFPAFLMGGFRAPWLVAGAVLFLAPMVAVFLQLALSRSREFNADLGAVELTRDPRGLALALERIERVARGGWLRRWLGNPADRGQPAWLRTHPPTEERVARLLEVDSPSAIHPLQPTPAHRTSSSPRPATSPSPPAPAFTPGQAGIPSADCGTDSGIRPVERRCVSTLVRSHGNSSSEFGTISWILQEFSFPGPSNARHLASPIDANMVQQFLPTLQNSLAGITIISRPKAIFPGHSSQSNMRKYFPGMSATV